jgi:hypothetical protein
MLRGITYRQFEEWRAYADLEPFEEERADLRAAQVVQAIYNVNRKKGSPPIKLQDCLITLGAQASQQPRTAAQAKAQAAQVRRTMDMLVDSQKPKPRKRG